jgi:hypothetical protein
VSHLKLSRSVPGLLVVFAILVANAPYSKAVLVAHFDPNQMGTLFQDGGENDGGTIPVTEFGQLVGWITDSRAASPGWNGTAIDGSPDIQQRNDPVKPTYYYHPIGGMLEFNGANNLLGFDDNVGARADGILGAFDTNVLQTVVAGRVHSSGSGNGYLIDLRNAGANDGFSVRYNYDTHSVEGLIRGEAVVSVPTPVGEYFVANLVWNGPASSATLKVTTLGGTVTDSGTPSDNTAINHDRFRLGSLANNGSNLVGLLGDIYLWNDTSDQSSLVNQLAQDYFYIPELLVNRETGNVSITVPGSAASVTNVAGYQMTSAIGALNPANWLSIAQNYDADHPGASQVDPDNNWTILSNANSRKDLSEIEFEQSGGASNGADFLAGRSTNLGNVWTRYYQEDIEMLLVLDDGTTRPLSVRFTGNGGRTFDYGDLNFDGVISEVDFYDVFVANYGQDTSALLSGPERYGRGDLNEDGRVSLEDFVLLNNAYLAANPGAASLRLGSVRVPEPAAWMLMTIGALCVALRRKANMIAAVAAGALVAFLSAAPTANAGIGGVIDFNFQWLEPGTVLNDGMRMQDFSGNRYHGVWGAGAAANNTPIVAAYEGATRVIDGENTPGYIILRGGLEQGPTPLDWWGTGPTPTPYFSLEPTKSYTFEAVLNWNGNTQANDGIMGQTGQDEWWIRENNGFLEYAFDDGPNRAVNTGTININSLIDNDSWHHVGITFARDAVDPTQVTVTSYIDYQQVFQETLAAPLGDVGDPTADLRLGAYNTNAGNSFDGLMAAFRISDEVLAPNQFLPLPAPPQFILQVNKVNGQVKIINETGVDLTISAYRLTSETGTLNPAGWNSLEDQDYEQQGANSGWTELGKTSFELSEAFFGDASTLSSPTILSLGAAYSALGTEDQTLRFEYLVPGETGFRDMFIQFTDVVGGLPGDFNGDGRVDARDYVVWRNHYGQANDSVLSGNGNNTPGVDIGDYQLWKSHYGDVAPGALAADGTAVPEPATAAMLLTIMGGVLLRCRRKFQGGLVRSQLKRAALVVCCLLIGSSAARAATNDRFFAFGDPGTSDVLLGAAVANGSPMGFLFNGQVLTADEVGPSGGFTDLVVNGVSYASVSNRPGAGGSDFGARFDGVDDYLSTTLSLNIPSNFWDNNTFFPNGEFPLNYEGIFSHGISFWAKPDQAKLGNGSRQDLVIDTPENGVYISGSGNWGLQFDGGGDSEVSVASTLDSNGWAHVMQIGGLQDLKNGSSPFQSALYVNGKAVMVTAASQGADANTTAMSVGANQAGTGNFYSGVIDNLAVFLWGDNSNQLGADGVPGGTNGLGGLNADGQNWGSFSLLEDNEYVALQIASLGIGTLKAADVNLDGSVNQSDVTALLGHWRKENIVNGIHIGDWETRQNGDLNLDGKTDIFDAIILRDGLAAAGAGALDLSLFTNPRVPEPGTAALAIGALVVLGGVTRRFRTRR